MVVSSCVNSIWHLQKPFIIPSETSNAMEEVWPKQLSGNWGSSPHLVLEIGVRVPIFGKHQFISGFMNELCSVVVY